MVAGRDYLIQPYLDAIEIELSHVSGRPQVETIYLGGGTPTRLPPAALERLLDLLDQHFEFAQSGEFTIEGNPDDFSEDVGKVLQSSEVNRISLGVQSFDLAKLKALDRHHDPAQVESALSVAKEIADRVSVDLIFAAPGESIETWQSDLARAVATGVTHLSTYELTFEKGTQFWSRRHKNELTGFDDDTTSLFFETTIDYLQRAGFTHYEVSSFAREGHRSRHNQTYWNTRACYAFGPGASGLVNETRFTNHRSVSRYLKSVLANESPVEDSHQVSRRELAIDQIVFGLRMLEGVDLPLLEQRTGWRLEEIVPARTLATLENAKLVEQVAGRLRLTKRGLFLGDSVCSQILRDSTRL